MFVIGFKVEVQTANLHSLDIEQSLRMLVTDAQMGLGAEEAETRLALSNSGKQKQTKQSVKVMRIPDHYRNVLVMVLVASSVLSAVIGDGLIEAVLIVAILAAGMIITALQNNSVYSTLRNVKKLIIKTARVKRDGQVESIDVSKLVVGDIVYFDRGDIIPADMRIIESNKLLIDELTVTGEDDWVRKEALSVFDVDTPINERYNLAYMGSIVTFGRGVGAVYATGADTIRSKYIKTTIDAEDTATHLQTELARAAGSLNKLFLLISALTLAAGLLYHFLDLRAATHWLTMLVTASALAVATMPRNLNAIAASIMANGVRKMVKSGNIVKNFRTALAIGNTSVICTSKTGVLTKNIMTITHVADSENSYEVTGVGYKAKGHVAAEIMITRNIALMSEIVVLCNNATYDKKNAEIFGEPTEGAMLVFGAKLGHDKKVLNEFRPRIQEKPFDSDRKIMSTYNMDEDRVIMYTKGAAEEVIYRCSYVYLDGEIVFLSDTIRARLLARCDEFASKALRVMACAYKVYEKDAPIDSKESDLIYVGTMGLSDPLRDELVSSIKKCNDSGLQVKLITGEHKGTARAIAQAFGIIDENDEVLDGYQINAMTDEELESKVEKVNVYARVSPEHKLRIVTAIHKQTESNVAMTGVDIDDVPALKKADIGIAMGHSGKDIVHETADIILSNDNLTGLVDAVEEGKTIYANIRKTISYSLICKFCILLVVFFAVLLGLPVPLPAPILLLMSLIITSLAVPAVGMEKKEIGVLARWLKNPEDSIINRRVITTSIIMSVIIFVAGMSAYLYGLFIAIVPERIGQSTVAAGMCFFTLITCELLYTFVAKTDLSMWASGTAVKNMYVNATVLLSIPLITAVCFAPALSGLFSLTPLSAGQITICLLLIVISFVVCELMKNSIKFRKNDDETDVI